MKDFCFLNGEYKPVGEATISVFDHGFGYGDGIFEGIRCYHGKVFRIDEHIARLYRGLKALMIEMPYGPEKFKEYMLKLVEMNEVEDCYMRVTITRGNALGLDPRNIKTEPTVFIATAQLSLYPESAYENGLTLATVSTRIANPQVVENRIKATGKYLINIQAKLESIQQGAGEGLMLTEDGYLGECTGDNLFFIKNGVIYTPAAHLGILEGITRQTTIEIAKGLGYEVVEGVFTRFDLYTCDEAFLTGTAAEVIPMVECDRRKIGDGKPGEITWQLIRAFRDYVKNYTY